MIRQGIVKRFSTQTNYGFLGEPSCASDVFVHRRDVVVGGKPLKPGQRVLFELEQGERGLKARSVRVVQQEVRHG